MEIKTCEQYVLNELHNLQRDFENAQISILDLSNEIQQLKNELVEFDKLKKVLNKRLSFGMSSSGINNYVRLDFLWNDDEDYDELVKYVDKDKGNND